MKLANLIADTWHIFDISEFSQSEYMRSTSPNRVYKIICVDDGGCSASRHASGEYNFVFVPDSFEFEDQNKLSEYLKKEVGLLFPKCNFIYELASSCEACRYNEPGQRWHMRPGGCLYIPGSDYDE